MSDAVFVVLVFAFGAAFFVGLFLFVRKRQEQAHQPREEECARRGWRYRRGVRSMFRVEGELDGIPFEVIAHKNRGNNSGGGFTVLRLPAEPIDGVALVGPKLPSMFTGMDLGGMMIQMMLKKFLGDEAADLKNVTPVDAGSAALRDKCSVLASDRMLAQNLLNDEVTRLLLKAADAGQDKQPVVFRWRNRFDVRVLYVMHTIDEVAELVELGGALGAASEV